MDILGIGPLELALILLLALIVLGPKDLQKTGKTIGRTLNSIIRSDTWKTITQTSKELRQLPNKLMREANIDAFKDTVNQIKMDARPKVEAKDQFPDWSSPPPPKKPAAADDLPQENKIAPPEDESPSE